jgi:MFS family permease
MFRRPEFRTNFALFMTIECLWAFGVWLANASTVLPNFMIRLGASTTVVGLLPALWGAGQIAGALAIGAFAVHRPQLGRFMGVWHLAAITPYLGLAALGFAADRWRIPPWLGQSLALSMLVVFNVIIGAMMQLYMVLLGRLLPRASRARLIAFLFGASQATGLLGPVVASQVFILADSTMSDYGRLFLTAFACFLAGSLPFFFFRERLAAILPPRTIRENIAVLVRTWRSMLFLRRYITARIWLGGGGLAFCFLATYSRAEVALSEHATTWLGELVVVGEAASCLALSLLIGTMLRRSASGHRDVYIRIQWIIQLGFMAALALAALKPCLVSAIVLALAAGLGVAGDLVAHPNIIYESGPSRRHTDMIALAAVMLSIVTMILPPLAGYAIGLFGHRVVFAAAVLAGLPGLAGLWRMSAK